MHSVQLAANFQCSSVNLAHLFLREKCEEFCVSHLPSPISKVQKDEFPSSEGVEFLFSVKVLGKLVSKFCENASLATQLAFQKAVSASKSPLSFVPMWLLFSLLRPLLRLAIGVNQSLLLRGVISVFPDLARFPLLPSSLPLLLLRGSKVFGLRIHVSWWLLWAVVSLCWSVSESRHTDPWVVEDLSVGYHVSLLCQPTLLTPSNQERFRGRFKL